MGNPTTITIDGTQYVRSDAVEPSPKRIVVLQRGWVFIGTWAQTGTECVLTDAQNIRVWGTTRGLSELIDGPTSKTVLDPAGTVRFHEMTVVCTLDVDGTKW